jgi:hypothetical protein
LKSTLQQAAGNVLPNGSASRPVRNSVIFIFARQPRSKLRGMRSLLPVQWGSDVKDIKVCTYCNCKIRILGGHFQKESHTFLIYK